MLDEHVDLVAGDFNGAAWRCSNRNNISTIDAFADCALPTPPGSTPFWEPGSVPGGWSDVCGFLKPPESDRHWKVRLHGAFSIPHGAPGLRPTDQRCHHETWLHLDFEWQDVQPQREKYHRGILLKERPAPYHHGKQKRRISDIMSDHSLSSWHCDHSRASIKYYVERVHPHQVIWWRFPFQFHGLACFDIFASFLPVVDHPHRMHVHPDHPDTASEKIETYRDYINLAQKSCQVYTLDMH